MKKKIRCISFSFPYYVEKLLGVELNGTISDDTKIYHLDRK